MAGDHAALIAQLQARREKWVDVAPGKAVKLRRPAEGAMAGMFVVVDGKRSFRVQPADVVAAMCDWRGFTEADLLGEGIGNSDALAFDAEVASIALMDNLDWLQAAIEGFSVLVVDRMQQRAAARGNSFATSTQPPAPTVDSSTSTTSPSH